MLYGDYRYSYCGNNPINFIDLWGLCSEKDGGSTDKIVEYQLDSTANFAERHIDNLLNNNDPISKIKDYYENLGEFYSEVQKDSEGIVELGGKYGVVDVIRGEQERHHIISTAALKATGVLSPYLGPVVVMSIEDHRQTSSWGSSDRAIEYRQNEIEMIREGLFLEVAEMGIQDVRRIAEEQGDPHRYDQAIEEMEAYIDTIDPQRYTPN